MSNDTRRSGSCLCGGVQFSVIGDPLRVGLCHCKDCRKTSGSAYSAFAVWPIEAFETTGIVTSYGGRSFCPTCGGRVTEVRDDEAEVMIGSLDLTPTEGLEPGYELWIGRREHWLQPVPKALQFEHDRIDGDQANVGGQTGQPEPAPNEPDPVPSGIEAATSGMAQRKSA